LQVSNQASPLTSSYNPQSLFSLIIVAGLIFGLDQFAKTMVVNSLALYESWAPIPALERIFRFTYIHNTGAAFGMFSKSGSVFVVVAIVVAAAIFYFYPLVSNWLVKLSLGLQLGGAMGNLWDRIFNNGAVIDYVDIGFWPIFNIADISIVTGVTILAVWLWQLEAQASKQQPPQAEGTD